MCKGVALRNSFDQRNRRFRREAGGIRKDNSACLTLTGRCESSVIRPGIRDNHRLPGCVIIADTIEKYGASGRIRTSDRSVRSRVLYPAELRMHRGYCFTAVQRRVICGSVEEHGASGRIRTSDRSVRSRVLYPAELRMHRGYYFTAVHVIIADTVEKYGASGRIIRLRLTLTGRC